MNSEFRALKKHLEARGLDDAEVIQLMTTWLGVACARHSMDPAALEKRVEAMAKWIRESAEHTHVQLHVGRIQ